MSQAAGTREWSSSTAHALGPRLSVILPDPASAAARTTGFLRRAIRVTVGALHHPRTVALPTLIAVASFGAGVGVSRADAIALAGQQVTSSLLSDLNMAAGEAAGSFTWLSAHSGAFLTSAALNTFGPAGLATLWASAAQSASSNGGAPAATAFGTTRLAATAVGLGSLVGGFGDAGHTASPIVTALPRISPLLVQATLEGPLQTVAVAAQQIAGNAGSASGEVATSGLVGSGLAASALTASTVAASTGAAIPGSNGSATDFASLFAVQQQIDLRGGTSFADIRITRLASGGWTVQIPSTQGSFIDPVAAANPNDVVADVVAMAGKQTALGRAVTQAMTQAGIGEKDPVMMVGFSLGGITAAQLVSDPSFPFTVTHIVTAGAPIASFPVPERVNVLSLELRQDAVPKLDGAENPSRPTWATVEGEAPLLPGEDGAPGIAGAHNTLRYAALATSLVAAGNASVGAFVASAPGFFSGAAESTDYAVTR